MTKSKKPGKKKSKAVTGYDAMLSGVAGLLEEARRNSVRAVNAIMTATYWEIGRRIVEYEQQGRLRAQYGTQLLERLSLDLNKRFGRGFSVINLRTMRRFYEYWHDVRIRQTVSVESISRKNNAERQILQTLSGKSKGVNCSTVSSNLPSVASQAAPVQSSLHDISVCFPLPWSHYVRLISVENTDARTFYEAEALRGGWSVRQLDRQISTRFYERTALSRNKAAMLRKGEKPRREDIVTAEEEIRDPLVLEFLGLKDEYTENELEESLVRHIESFLLELGGDFTFVGRQRRLRIGDSWYRIDLLFYHRRLRCLVVIDLKPGKFTHADARQMHTYLNYVRDHWTHQDENPPVGLILCAEKDHVLARYALEGLPNKVLTAEYKMALPNEKSLVAEINKTRKALESRRKGDSRVRS